MASVSISCPSCSATDGVVRNGKSTAGHQRYLCSHCRKTWQLQFTYTASQHLARLGRKSLSFSKSVELHDKVIGHYLNIKHYQ
ncbi:IS1 family transposase [Escherichia coli]|uniref:IS1 family transposase n=1 Tax=Escherichia coli TaxID=562 RepID=UPI0029C3E71E|nr:IS1 family transposase [Escherichia coli]MDX5537961.1 IS1 family transposase [Escherichia coli]